MIWLDDVKLCLVYQVWMGWSGQKDSNMITSLFMILQVPLTMKHIKYGRAIPFLVYSNQLGSGANVTLAAIAR